MTRSLPRLALLLRTSALPTPLSRCWRPTGPRYRKSDKPADLLGHLVSFLLTPPLLEQKSNPASGKQLKPTQPKRKPYGNPKSPCVHFWIMQSVPSSLWSPFCGPVVTTPLALGPSMDGGV